MARTEVPEVSSDGRTVWVHSKIGYCVARWCPVSFEIIRVDKEGCATRQVSGQLFGPGGPSTKDWKTFVEEVWQYHRIKVSQKVRPKYVRKE